MEGIGKEIRQEPPLGILHPRDVADQAERRAVAHAAHHRVQPDGRELLHEGLGADPMVA